MIYPTTYSDWAKCSVSKSDFARKLGYNYINGTVVRLVDKIIRDHNLDVFHFRTHAGGQNKKYELVEKQCPVCQKKFTTRKGSKREKATCSHGCSNTHFFRSKRWASPLLKTYTAICFRYHPKKCVCCDEKRIVAVHHHDGNHKNNAPENLIPLCPTHHQYWHSRYRNMVADKILKYRNDFIAKQNVA